MTAEKYLTYRGDIKGAVGVGRMLAFVTVHPEGQPTALYRLDADKLTLDADPLPKGGTAIAAVGETLFVAGGDGRIYRASIASGEPKPLGAALDAPAIALAPLADGRLAALVESRVVILSTKDGKPVQTLDLPEPGTCLAADPTGRWLAVGTAKGTVLVFDREEKPEFLPERLGAAARGGRHRDPVRAGRAAVPLGGGRPEALLDPRPRQARARGQGARQQPHRRRHGADLGPGRPPLLGQPRRLDQVVAEGGRGQAGHDQGRGRPRRRPGDGPRPRPAPAGRGVRRQHDPGLPGRRGGQDRRLVAPGL